MSRPQSITFANLICRFGNKYVLLDFAEQIVLPAFFDVSLRRKFGSTEYLFLNTEWAKFTNAATEKDDLIIFGQLVKDTVLSREQVLLHGELVQDPESMPSAPSAFFVFILSNHKLILFPETPSAPTLDIFASTFENFLRRKRDDFVAALHRYRMGTPDEVTKASLFEAIPPPRVEAVPLASQDSIEEFISSIAVLTSLEFRLLDTNRETQMLAAYRQFREKKIDLRAKTTKIIFANPQGLDKDEATTQIHDAAASGNQTVIIGGKALDGSRISGNNERIRLHVPATDLPAVPERKAFRLLEIFRTQAESGTLALDAGDDTGDQVDAIAKRLPERTNLGQVPQIDAGPLFLETNELARAATGRNLLGRRSDGI